jgi:GIY-YIG catalytic domain.
MRTWELYVLRYDFSGYYYVGITPDLEERMNKHKRRSTENIQRLPRWSYLNRSKEGFRYYWFELTRNEKTQDSANYAENALTRHIANEIEKIVKKQKYKNLNIEIRTIGGDLCDKNLKECLPEDIAPVKNGLGYDLAYEEIHNFIKRIKSFEIESKTYNICLLSYGDK